MNIHDIKKIVEDLYNFRDFYFEDCPDADDDQRTGDLESELIKTLSILEENRATFETNHEAEFHFFEGRAMNVLSNYSPQSEKILTRLVKFHPKFVEAWNELGEVFWKKEDVKQAKVCFECALKESRNAASLRHMSMVLRQLPGTNQEKVENINQSVKLAHEAVNLNVKDGKSWYILGNAYLSTFFNSNQNPKILKQCLSSYSHAISDKSMTRRPDLYYNRAVALKYDENYRGALESFERAILLDPTWDEPREKLEGLMTFLENVQSMVANKGKLKPRKIQQMIDTMYTDDVGPYFEQPYATRKGKEIILESVPFAEINEGANPGRMITGRVVCHVFSTDAVAFTFCMIDGYKNCVAVNLYNIAPGKGVIIGDIVTIPEPTLEYIDFSYKGKAFVFKTVRVDNPHLIVVNKKKWGYEHEAALQCSGTFKGE